MDVKRQNYKGVRPASIVTVLEGNGSTEYPFENVDYVLVFESVSGITRQVTKGRILPLKEDVIGQF